MGIEKPVTGSRNWILSYQMLIEMQMISIVITDINGELPSSPHDALILLVFGRKNDKPGAGPGLENRQ